MTIPEMLREHAKRGTNIYEAGVFQDEAFDALMDWKSEEEKSTVNDGIGRYPREIVGLYMLFVAEAIESEG